MSNLRQIEPLTAWEGLAVNPNLGPKPSMRWVDPTELWVDDDYQRDLGRRSFALIRKLCGNFSWLKMKWPKCVEVGGKLHVVDGQHTAIAAATLQIPKIPVIVDHDTTDMQRADAFVAHQQDRVAMTSFDLHHAKIKAGDQVANDVVAACKKAGARIRIVTPGSRMSAGDTGAVSTVSGIVKRRGVDGAVKVLSVFVRGDRAPVSAAELDAAEHLLFVRRPDSTPTQLAEVVKAMGERGFVEARAAAQMNHQPAKIVLVEAYERRLGQPMKKRA